MAQMMALNMLFEQSNIEYAKKEVFHFMIILFQTTQQYCVIVTVNWCSDVTVNNNTLCKYNDGDLDMFSQ